MHKSGVSRWAAVPFLRSCPVMWRSLIYSLCLQWNWKTCCNKKLIDVFWGSLHMLFFLVQQIQAKHQKIEGAFRAELVSCANIPSSKAFLSPSLLSFSLTPLRPLSTIFYIFLVLRPIPHPQPLHYVNFFTFPHHREQFPPLLQPPTSLSLRFSTPMSVLLVFAPVEHRRRVIYLCEGNKLTVGEQQAIPGIHISCSQRSRWEGAQHSRVAFSPSLWNHGLRAFRVQWMCQYMCHCMRMHACVWLPGPYVHV